VSTLPAAPSPSAVDQLIERSNRLGSDRRNTNYGGGNTSAKAAVGDPVTGDDVDVMWVKGSGGDLGTLTAEGLSALRLDRVRALKQRYVGIEQEDELHQLLDHCAFGSGGAAPSIDTSMHGLLRAANVDHLHPDSVIAIAASADGERLTKQIFGDRIGWVAWQRPGFDLALKIEQLRDEQPLLQGVIMGGHGLTTWAEASDDCEAISLDVIRTAADYIEQHGKDEPLGPLRVGFEPLDQDERRKRAARLGPVIRGLASTDRHVVGRWLDDDVVLDFIGREATPRVAPLGTSCPDHFIRTKVRPLLLDLPTDAPFDSQVERLRTLHEEYRQEYRLYYERHAEEDTPAMRGADPAIFLIPGVGMFSFGADSHTARVAGEFYINAINVIRGAEAISTYTPVSDGEKFRVEYWILEEMKLRRRPAPKPLTGKVALVTDAGSAVGQAIARRYEDAGAVVVVADSDETSASTAIEAVVLKFCGVDIIVSPAGPSIADSTVSSQLAVPMIAQRTGGDLVFVGPGPDSGLGRVEPLAAELGEHQIRVNGLDANGAPDDRKDHAEHVARAALALVDGSLSKTTGLTISVGG